MNTAHVTVNDLLKRLLIRGAIMSFILGSHVCAEGNGETQNFLSGEVKHSEKLPALKGGVKVGQQASTDDSAMMMSGRWFQIPNWLGGTWRSVQVTRLSTMDEKTGDSDTKPTIVQSRERETFGFQMDRNEKIWTCASNVEPIVYSSTLKQVNKEGDEESIPVIAQITRENALLNSSTEKIIIKSVESLITSRKDNHVVQSVDRRELIRTITLIEPSVIAIYTDMQTYDSSGYPEKRETLCEFRKKEKGFQVQNEVRGTSLYSSFSKFLQTSGHLGLMPEKR